MKNVTAGLAIDLASTLDALRQAVARTAAMLERAQDPNKPVPGLTWTVEEVAAHLAGDVQHYTGFITGHRDAHDYLDLDPDGSTPTERSVAGNARLLEEFAERDLKRLAVMLRSDVEEFARACTDCPADVPILTETGLFMTAPTMAAALLGEQIIHGLDIARALQQPWPISREDALLVIAGVMALAPSYVDPVATAGLRVSYELRFRGGPRYRLAIDDGDASIEPGGPAVDCRLSIDPVAFLLVASGRSSQWTQILRGKMLAAGRQPWQSLKFGKLLSGI